MEKYSKKQKVFNLIVLDESGSMSAIEKQAVAGVNETLQTISNAQREHAEQEHFVSFVTFNSNGIRTVMNRKQVEGGKALKWTDYQPNACTPLYDAMGQSINELKGHVNDEDVVLVTIITDGMENASREFCGKDIKKLVSDMKEKGWVFAYIGTNQDVDAVADSMGIRSRMNYEYSQTGAEEMFNVEHCRRSVFYCKLANEGKDFMRRKDFDFFEEEKRKEEKALEPKDDEPETNEKSQGFWGKFKNWLDKE